MRISCGCSPQERPDRSRADHQRRALADQIDALRAADGRITVSLDTLKRDCFAALTRFDRLDAVHEGMQAAARGLRAVPRSTAWSCVCVNDDELVDLISATRSRTPSQIYQNTDVGGATRWSPDQVIAGGHPRHLARHTGPSIPSSSAHRLRPTAIPFRRHVFGIIVHDRALLPELRSRVASPATACALCACAQHGIDLRGPIRRGASAEELAELISAGWRARTDRGAESRLALGERGPSCPSATSCGPHLEMHTRG
jgi:cyclic pyranopterin phosphate synthase